MVGYARMVQGHISNSKGGPDAFARIRAASVDGMVRTYDLRMGMLRCDDCKSPVTSLAVTEEAASCLDGTICLVETGQVLNTFSSHHAAGQYGLQCALTADDKHKCRMEACKNTAVSIWATNLKPDDPWPMCETCQETEFGGWPQGMQTRPPSPPPP